MEQRLMAFWKYDTFPGYLSGEVIEFKDNGRIIAKGYDSMQFVPFLIKPYESGLEMRNELLEITAEYNNTIKDIDTKYREKIKNLIG